MAQAEVARLIRQQAIKEFLEIHEGVPRLYDFKEIGEINVHRPQDDQIELTQSRLLKHHCAFPKCPGYLQSFASTKDKALNRRDGLFKHLKYFFLANDEYIPGFHLIAAVVLNHKGITKDSFVQTCLERMKEKIRQSKVEEATRWLEFIYNNSKQFVN